MLNGQDKERARMMLKIIKDDIKKNYYDPSFHGVDIEAKFKAADEKLEQATSNGQAFGIIAQSLLDLNDSHTFFLPPQRAARTDYGWLMQMVGEQCLVTAVKPGSDAEAKGLKPGDIIHTIDGYKPTRENIWLLHYLYDTLQPRAGTRLVIQSPDGPPRQLDVLARVKQGKKVLDLTSGSGLDLNDLLREAEDDERLNAHRYYEMSEAFIWKMPHFDLPKDKVDEMMDKARKAKALILDLRDNSGGYEETLLRLVGNLFDHDITIGQIKRRKETKPLVAKTRGGDGVFKGPLVVLVDSNSGSASELLARVVQLEKRGTVVGDRTAGAVMRARGYGHQLGVDTVVFYGTSITDADILMSDGNSLERVGVTPDKLLLPTGAELRAQRDPVLALAASLVGLKLEPEKAGTLFPVRWKL
jgi:C-terminal processing protease CtpA/Prc